jgi:hypothetical protein
VTDVDVNANKLLYMRSELLNDDRGVGSANVAYRTLLHETMDFVRTHKVLQTEADNNLLYIVRTLDTISV